MNKYGPHILPTHRWIRRGSPFGTLTMRDEKGNPKEVTANRAARRADRHFSETRLERLVRQEAGKLRIRRLLKGDNQ